MPTVLMTFLRGEESERAPTPDNERPILYESSANNEHRENPLCKGERRKNPTYNIVLGSFPILSGYKAQQNCVWAP